FCLFLFRGGEGIRGRKGTGVPSCALPILRLFSVAVHRLPFRKALTSENCGFVLCTKCGPCRTARKQFSKGLRSKTGVQQHPKNTQKRLFQQAESPLPREPFRFVLIGPVVL